MLFHTASLDTYKGLVWNIDKQRNAPSLVSDKLFFEEKVQYQNSIMLGLKAIQRVDRNQLD